MPPQGDRSHTYTSIPDVESNAVLKDDAVAISNTPTKKDRYELSSAFSLLSATVWASMSVWGVWIAVFYSTAVRNKNWHNMNIIFPDMWTEGYPIASTAIAVHLLGAVVMAVAGAIQLVKYIRSHYAVVHRWIGRLYIVASIVASVGGLVFILFKGSYGGREADVAFGIYGAYFLFCGIQCYYQAAIKKDFTRHKLWAWRLYALSLASWVYRADYYWWMLIFGRFFTPRRTLVLYLMVICSLAQGHKGWTWLHNEATTGLFDYFVNWAFYVPNLIIVEVVFRWGENAQLTTKWARILDVLYYVAWIMAVVFTLHAASQLWLPSVFGGYDESSAWIFR